MGTRGRQRWGQARLPSWHPAGSEVSRQPPGASGPGLTPVPTSRGSRETAAVRVTDDDGGRVSRCRQAPEGCPEAQGPRTETGRWRQERAVRAGGSGREGTAGGRLTGRRWSVGVWDTESRQFRCSSWGK